MLAEMRLPVTEVTRRHVQTTELKTQITEVHSIIFNASFLRLSNATLGYNLPKSVLTKMKISKFRLYTTVQNAFCITKYPGTDPESGENFNAPMPRKFMFGINMSL